VMINAVSDKIYECPYCEELHDLERVCPYRPDDEPESTCELIRKERKKGPVYGHFC
jgi:hypothetical protein